LDYEKGALGYRLNSKRVLHEPLAKIIDKKAFVLDTTGGILKDALLMAFLGCKVWTCEAHPIIAKLAQDGLARARNNPIFANIICDDNRFKFFNLDSSILLEEFLDNKDLIRPDIIYLDPMFGPKRKTSIAKKELQWLQRIHAVTKSMFPEYSPSGAENIFLKALKVAQKRVVIKRPKHAQTLISSPAPSFSKSFQSARFDVYLTGS
jgi:16S rRNA (guanine1516-N2)-methyltransferase